MTSRVTLLSENIAEIVWNPETMRVTDISFFREDLRFKCKRCAVFCCKLGGPRMSKEDIQRLKRAGYEPVDFLDVATDRRAELDGGGEYAMKQREDGSCIFLEHSNRNEAYRCSIYEFRPTLCRLYPFEFERIGVNTAMLMVIPCCNGLSARDGSVVDRRAITELFGAILHLL